MSCAQPSARPSACRSSSPARVGPRLRGCRQGGRRVRRRRRRDHRPRRQDGRPRRDRRASGSRAARSPTAGRPSSIPAGRSSATRCTASRTRTSRAPRRRARRPQQFLEFVGDGADRRPQRRLRPRFLEAALGDGTRIEQGRYFDTLTLAREAYPDLDALHARPTSPASSASSSSRATAPSRTQRPPRRCSSGSPTTWPARRDAARGRRRLDPRLRADGGDAEAKLPRGGPPPGARRQEPVRAASTRRPSAS